MLCVSYINGGQRFGGEQKYSFSSFAFGYCKYLIYFFINMIYTVCLQCLGIKKGLCQKSSLCFSIEKHSTGNIMYIGGAIVQ